MQDTDLFLELAGIAGVFVGFGALIAIRSPGTSDVQRMAGIGMVVTYGIMVVVLALAPVAISRFGVTGHPLWMSCGLAFLAVFWGGDAALMRASADRRAWMASVPPKRLVGYAIGYVLGRLPMTISLLIIVLGLMPDQESALYFAATVLLLFLDALLLLGEVQGSSQTA